jgi:large subunit ribosomal protein L9
MVLTMQLILKDDVKNLGLRGEVVEVEDGYARNFLLPNQKAVRATDANMKQYQREQEMLEEQREQRIEDARDRADELKTLELTLEKNAAEEGSLYGSISQEDVVDALEDEGYEDIQPRQVIIENAIKEIGDYTVRIKLFESVEAEVGLEVVPA